MTSETLRECPFCGDADIYNAFPKSAAECGVIACRACGAEGPDAGPGRHITAWQARSLPAALAVVIEAVEARADSGEPHVRNERGEHIGWLRDCLAMLRALRAAETAPQTPEAPAPTDERGRSANVTQEITYYCSFCDKRETVEAPTSFRTYCGDDIEDAACAEHAPAMDFLNDQCPGCVSGWGECGMFMAIGNGTVTPADLLAIKAGRCPYRTNGTFMVGPKGVEDVNLSERSEAGEAFAAAITDSNASPDSV